jgi:polysaccharide export outer membrane protein
MKCRAAAASAIATIVGACGILPSSGPSSSALRDTDVVTVVKVTPQQAQSQAERDAHAQTAAVELALAALAKAPQSIPFRFSPGDAFGLTVFTIPASTNGDAGVPSKIDMGAFTVAADGTVVLPYVGTLPLKGLSLARAQELIAGRFAKLGIMQSPSVKIDVSASPRNSILVTGALGQPKWVSWSPAGVTLADAVTQALGNGVDLLGSTAGDPTDRSAIDVAVFRGVAPGVKLPMQTALEHEIELVPGDRVIVSKKPAVRIIVLGGGVARNGNYEYARNPTLATVLAQASGLDTNIANNRAVFVLEQRGRGQRPVLYDFAWNHAAGFTAAQVFPLRDGSLVYVDEAAIVPLQKVLNTLLPVAAVANVVRR